MSANLPRLDESIMPSSSDLIDQLDQWIPKVVVTPNDNLEDVKVRQQISVRVGERNLVDRLIAIRRNKREEH